MANLLANPSRWWDMNDVLPPACWNGSEYSVQYEPYEWREFPDLYLDGEAAPGDVIAGTIIVSTEAGADCYVVLSSYDTVAEDWSAVDSVHVSDSTLTSFSFSDLPEGSLMLRVASTPSGGSPLYAYDYSATITPGQDAEIIANDDHSTVQAGATVVTNVLANDTVDGAPATLQTVTLPTITRHPEHGTVEVNQDGTITYTPDPGFVGEDSFEYEILEAAPECATLVEDYVGEVGYVFFVSGLSSAFDTENGAGVRIKEHPAGGPSGWEVVGQFVDGNILVLTSHNSPPYGDTVDGFVVQSVGEAVSIEQCAEVTFEPRM